MTYSASTRLKTVALATSALSVLMFAATAHAQAGPGQPAEGNEAAEVGEVVVTGSRIVRQGYTAPTPLAVIDATALQDRPTANAAELVNTMPVFAGSTTPQNTGGLVSAGTSGVNALNLRNLGSTRTLVLIDGQRSVGSYLTGAVDINTIPQQLIERVEVVTGGASAVYGSDAVGGVVNFILNKTFTGFKAEASAGTTAYNDDDTWGVQFTAGTRLGDRAHVTLSGEITDRQGMIGSGGRGKRDWMTKGWTIVRNPNYTATNGQPELLVRDQVSLSVATLGGLITTGPLKGTAFTDGGAFYTYNYGALNDGRNMQGGDWASTNLREDAVGSLSSSEQRKNLFFRGSYELTDNLNVFAQASWAQSETVGNNGPVFNVGNITGVRVDNAFLPTALRTRALAAGATDATTFTMGSFNADLPYLQGYNTRTITRYVVGADGEVDLFGKPWKWDAYYQHGAAVNDITAPNMTRIDLYALARDAIRNPAVGGVAGVAAGAPICRSRLANPTNGCVPYNLFGIGVNGPDVIKYLASGTSELEQTLKQDVWAASITGEPFSLWAGPISVALNLEHRVDSVDGHNDPVSVQRLYFSGNYQVTTGTIKVSEAAAEAVIPLAKDQPWAFAWDLQLAGRITDYSTSGRVETWKVGTTYNPYSDLKIRASQSRDIRAPNLQELFEQAGSGGSSGLLDPFTNTQVTAFNIRSGNLNLKPEIADTFGIGAVFQPSFLPGFGASMDYWRIDIEDAIGSINSQQTVDLCFRGGLEFCPSITRNAQGLVQTVIGTSYNIASTRARGIDFEASYRFPLANLQPNWSGNLSLRTVATRYLENYTDTGIGVVTDTAGENTGNGPPDWRYTVSLAYDNNPFRVSLLGRGVSKGVYSNSYVLCQSSCPASTVDNRTIDFNEIKGQIFWDASVNYTFAMAKDRNVEVFANIRNLFNSDPKMVAPLGSGLSGGGVLTNQNLYDTLGRVYRVGFRVRL